MRSTSGVNASRGKLKQQLEGWGWKVKDTNVNGNTSQFGKFWLVTSASGDEIIIGTKGYSTGRLADYWIEEMVKVAGH